MAEPDSVVVDSPTDRQKYLRVGTLIKTLETLSADDYVTVNRVGNLTATTRAVTDGAMIYIGFIDFNTGALDEGS